MTAGPMRMIVVGAGGHGREILELLRVLDADQRRFRVLGFVDDAEALRGAIIHGLPVLGTLQEVMANGAADVAALGIGSPVARRRVARRLRDAGLALPALVHPQASLGRSVRVAEGAVIAAGAVLTCDVTVGEGAIVNIGCTVSHDAVLDAYATLAPGVRLCGATRVGVGSDLGAGSVLIQGVRVGDWSIVGAGAVVTDDLPSNITAVGIPARVVKTRNAGWANG